MKSSGLGDRFNVKSHSYINIWYAVTFHHMFGLDGLKYKLDQPRFWGENVIFKSIFRNHIFLELKYFQRTHTHTKWLIENTLSCICENMACICFGLSHSTNGCLLQSKNPAWSPGQTWLNVLRTQLWSILQIKFHMCWLGFSLSCLNVMD